MECSAAVSCTWSARERDVIGMGEGAMEPRSIRMGVRPSSDIMMFPFFWLKGVCEQKIHLLK